MEDVGNLIIGLHRNLREIQAAIQAKGPAQTREDEILQGTIQRAEHALRSQARQLVTAAAASGLTGGFNGACQSAGSWPHNSTSHSQKRLLTGYVTEPAPPERSPSPAPPSAWQSDRRAASYDSSRRRPLQQPLGGKRDTTKTTQRQRLLPKINRLDPLAEPPALSEHDLNAGLYSLASRGFIPATADLTPALERGMPVIVHRPSRLYDQAHRRDRRDIAPAENYCAVKLDLQPAQIRSMEEVGPGRSGYAGTSPQIKAAKPLPPLPRAPDMTGTETVQWLALPAPPRPVGVAESYGTFCTELYDTADGEAVGDVISALAIIPEKPDKAELEALSATRLQAPYRGYRQRRRYAGVLHQHRAAKFIQGAWKATLIRIATKSKLLQIQEEEKKLQIKLLYELGQDWFQAKQLRRVEVHVCSLTVPESRRGRICNYQALQSAQIARIFRLIDQKRDVIFVAPKALHEDILDYYAKIMQFRGVKNPPGRFQVVVPENMGLAPHLSLTQGLLCSPKALKRIRKLTAGRLAMMIPEVVTHSELKLSSTLRLPMLGAGARNMSLLSSKSNAKKLAQIAELPIGPWAVDIYDEDEFYTSLAGLVVQHPKVRTWLFKIDDERDSRGHAYIDLSKLKEAGDSLRASMPNLNVGIGGTPNAAEIDEEEEPAVIGADASEVRAALQRIVPKKAVICNRRVYSDFSSWLAEACRVGAVIQAVPENMLSQTTVHFQIEPDGGISVLGTSEAMMSSPFVRAASWYPHTRGSFEVLHEVALRMGRCLAGKGLVGFTSVDVVFFDNPDFDPQSLEQEHREPSPAIIGSDTPINREDLMFGHLRSPSPDLSVLNGDLRLRTPSQPTFALPESRQAQYEEALQLQQDHLRGPLTLDPVKLMLGGSSNRPVGASEASPFACWIVDVDARLTEEAAMIFPFQFIAQVKLDMNSGFMRVTSDVPEEESSKTSRKELLSEEDKFTKSQRWALVNSATFAPILEKMNYQTLFQAAKLRGVSFDLFHNVGCMFTFLDVVHQLFSLLCVDRSPDLCCKRFASAIAAIAEGPPAKGGIAGARSTNQKIAAPRDAPLTIGRNDEASDTLNISDVQMALRVALKRWADKQPSK
jgi:hypothetical protein